MASVSLPELPTGDEFEEYISAFFQCGGYYVDRKLIERGEDEILELDIITSNYKQDSPPDIRLLEIKSGSWGFSDIFKVKGWMVYLNLNDGKFVVLKDRDARDYFAEKAKTLGIDLVVIPDLTKTAELLRPYTKLEPCGEHEIRLWRFSYWTERRLLERLYALKKKMHNHAKRYSALAEYFFLINNRTFFTENIVLRAEELYKAFQKYPHVSAKCGNEMLGQPFELDYDTLPAQIFRETFYECQLNDIAISTFVEHRARLAILKNAIDYTIYEKAGDEAKTKATYSFKVAESDVEYARIKFLPQAFRDGLSEIAQEPYFFRYPVFWQWFLWYFGGFILKDLKDKEYELFSRCTGIPADHIDNALGAYEKVFPMAHGWFSDLGDGSRVRVMKMMSLPFMGIGANVRRLAYSTKGEFEGTPTGGRYTIGDLSKWNNATFTLLTQEA
jgi:hypothetical protein